MKACLEKHNGIRFGILVLLVLLTMTACFTCIGCSTKTKGTTSAEKLTVAPAFGDNYSAVEAAALEKAPDAKLIAVKPSATITADLTPNWMYLFISREKVCSYTVFVEGDTITAGEYAQMSYTQEELDAIPDSDSIKVDADEAYQSVAKQLSDDEIVNTCTVYLMTYVEEDDDPTLDAMKWFFVFNYPGDDEDQNSTSSSTSSTTSNSSSSSASSSTDYPVFAYYVDAQTGEVFPASVDDAAA